MLMNLLWVRFDDQVTWLAMKYCLLIQKHVFFYLKLLKFKIHKITVHKSRFVSQIHRYMLIAYLFRRFPICFFDFIDGVYLSKVDIWKINFLQALGLQSDDGGPTNSGPIQTSQPNGPQVPWMARMPLPRQKQNKHEEKI